jgi:hypothetical protein
VYVYGMRSAVRTCWWVFPDTLSTTTLHRDSLHSFATLAVLRRRLYNNYGRNLNGSSVLPQNSIRTFALHEHAVGNSSPLALLKDGEIPLVLLWWCIT